MEEAEAWEGVACSPLAVKYPHPPEKQSHLKAKKKKKLDERKGEDECSKDADAGAIKTLVCVSVTVLFCLCSRGPLKLHQAGCLWKITPANQPKSLQ